MEQYELTQAVPEELPAYMEILDAGRAFQRQQGFLQWPDGYPDQASVEQDIRQGKGCALRVDGQLAGYLYIGFDGDPAYPQIKGAWRYDRPYAVIHRIALAPGFRGRGLADVAFRLAGELALAKGVDCLRIDTDEKNQRMRHILQKNGFACCGTVVQGGGDRLAYDKLLK